MRTVWKYDIQIDDRFTLDLPTGSVIRHVACQGVSPYMWVEVPDSNLRTEKRTFRVFGTGHDQTGMKWPKYLGSVFQGIYVWHIYEDRFDPETDGTAVGDET